jgi:hypothetical protein
MLEKPLLCGILHNEIKHGPQPTMKRTYMPISDQVLEAFYEALEKRPDLIDLAARFRAEPARTDAALKKIIFGEE